MHARFERGQRGRESRVWDRISGMVTCYILFFTLKNVPQTLFLISDLLRSQTYQLNRNANAFIGVIHRGQHPQHRKNRLQE